MAKAVINLQKESGGIVKISPVDGIGITEVTVPESGELATKFIGSFIQAYTIFDNCIVAFGGEFNRADYPKLWAYLQANPSLVKTQDDWTTENTANGMCGYYSSGNGTTTFRVPNLDKAFLRPDSRTIASYQVDEFKAHTHEVQTRQTSTGVTTGASFSVWAGAVLDSTLSVGGIETRPKNIAVLPLIVAK